MGSRSDEFFLERYKQGEKEAVLVENSPGTREWGTMFAKITSEEGFVPYLYSGASRDKDSSNIGDELRDEFYPARTKILCFGPCPSFHSTPDYENHWVLAEMRHVLDRSQDNVLVYVTQDFPQAILMKYGFNSTPTIISDAHEFAATLLRDLKMIMSNAEKA
jgi:hypothetical protein